MISHPWHRRTLRFATLAVLALAAAVQADKEQPNINDPFEPTPPQVVEEMLKFAQVTADDYVVDLGCGDGRIVIAAAKKFGARGFGVDLDPQRIEECKEGAEAAGVTDKTTFVIASYFDADIRPATVVATYLLAETNLSLRPKYFRELRPGVRVVSHCFDMDDWKPDKTTYSAKARENRILLWVIPAPVGGVWRWTSATESGEQGFRLELQQQFQVVSGNLAVGDSPAQPIRDVALSGRDFQFRATVGQGTKAATILFKGTVDGDLIKGSQKVERGPGAGEREWVARRDPVDITGVWRVSVQGSPGPLDGRLKIAPRKDIGLEAVYAMDRPTTETALPSWISWGTSIYFEIPPADSEEEERGPIFTGVLGAREGRGTVSRSHWPSPLQWTAVREK
ncbi:MAG: class I SAM-dependent methyltransferase [Candidatus Sumerlaeia bacterium]|nr:class I SAM-dependent methyltransferase [Candidatus Sumerlaeia bacterium]